MEQKRFNIEGMNGQQALSWIGDHLPKLSEQFAAGDKKAGRYIGVYYIMEAARRGDITSQVTLGAMYEFGNIVDPDPAAAAAWYKKALSQDHPRADGRMLAAGAREGMKRLETLQ